MLRGCIIAESLQPGVELGLPPLTLVGISRRTVTDPGPDQPGVWTLLDVEGPDEAREMLAAALAAGLIEGPWYADFRVGEVHVVVFPGRVFAYPIGDAHARQQAVDHGRSIGIPERQLDWGD